MRKTQAFTHLEGWELEAVPPTRLKAGVPIDGDFVAIPRDGFAVIDTANSLLWVRVNGTWTPIAINAQAKRATATASQGAITALVDLTGLTVTITTISGHSYKISAFANFLDTVADDDIVLVLAEGATQLEELDLRSGSVATRNVGGLVSVVVTPTAGSHTYKAQAARSAGTGTITMNAGATFPAWILVEDIGVLG